MWTGSVRVRPTRFLFILFGRWKQPKSDFSFFFWFNRDVRIKAFDIIGQGRHPNRRICFRIRSEMILFKKLLVDG